jgi:hypothetical protein
MKVIRMNASPPVHGRTRSGDVNPLAPPCLRHMVVALLTLAAACFSSAAQQGVGDPPRITNQPQSQIILMGATVSFHLGVAVSATPLSYQWHYNTTPIPDATNSTIWLFNAQTNQAGQYWATVVNATGSQDSQPATLTVIGPQGAGCVDVSLGSVTSQTFNNLGVTNQPNYPPPCDVVGGASRWRCLRPSQDGICIIDTMGSDIDTVLAVYTFSDTNFVDSLNPVICDDNSAPDAVRSMVRFPVTGGTDYLVQVDGHDGQQGGITLTWRLGRSPVITQQPANLLALTEGSKATISCVATGKPMPTYQWQFNGTNIPNATGPQLMLNHVLPADAGLYRAIVSNFIGTEITHPSNLQVLPPVQLELLGLSNGLMRLHATGPPGATFVYVLEASSDFQDWTGLATNNAASGVTTFLAPVDTGLAQRFFRVFRP